MSIDKVTDVLTKHGWPPATLTIVLMLAGALYILYQDHRVLQEKWEDLARGNLEASLMATTQRTELQSMLSKSLIVQDNHLALIQRMEESRLKQNQLDQQLTAAAVQALRQIAQKVDVQLQMTPPEDLITPSLKH